MLKQKGFTLIETIVVIAIIAILAGAIGFRLITVKRSAELDSAANILQSSFVEAKGKSLAPKPSTTLGQPSDVYGYGLRVNRSVSTNKEFTLFIDKTTGTTKTWDAGDTTVKTYKLADTGADNVVISDFKKDGVIDNSIDDRNMVFGVSEIPSQREIYLNGLTDCTTFSIVLKNTVDNNTKEISVNIKSGEVKIVDVPSGGGGGGGPAGGTCEGTVTIGTQTWMKCNMNVGTMVSGSAAQAIGQKYCYNNDENNCTTYGGLYQWNTAMNGSTTEGVQGICPTGFHIPSDAEWTTLTSYLGESTAGTQLKPGGSSGLNLPLAGVRGYLVGLFSYLDSYGYLWSSSQHNSSNAWYRAVISDFTAVGRNRDDKGYGFSVRCIQG